VKSLIKSFSPLPPLLLLLSLAVPAQAREISQQTAMSGQTAIAVEVGSGHTIDFSQSGEKVFRGWLGDGGRCLLLSPSSPLEEGASIINLRRITPCQQVAGLPEVSETTLTLVTLTPSGKTNIYEFAISYDATGDSLTRLVPDSQLAENRPTTEPRSEVLSLVAVEAGLATFNLAPESPVVARVTAWLEAVNQGQAQRLAAQNAALDWALLERLESVGKEGSPVEASVAI
jgi:hypothetical protein